MSRGPGQATAGRVVATHSSGPDECAPTGTPGQTEPCWCPLCRLCLGALRAVLPVARGSLPPAAAVLVSGGGADHSAAPLLRLSGMPLVVQGLEHLPRHEPYVAANHASYLDGPIVLAALPVDVHYVVKRELERQYACAPASHRCGVRRTF